MIFQVEQIVGQIDLKRQLSLYDIEQIFWAVQAKLCDTPTNTSTDPIQNMKTYLLPEEIIDSNEIYNNMVQSLKNVY